MKIKILYLTIIVLTVMLISSWIDDLNKISPAIIRDAEMLIGLRFDAVERDSMQENLQENLQAYQVIREIDISNEVAPAFTFNPIPPDFKVNEIDQMPIQWNIRENLQLPDNKDLLAFYEVSELASLIKSRKISSEELTKFYIQRLKDYADTLQCVVTITEELALRQARLADQEIASGNYKGPLHGIPYGVKDLLAVKGYKTTWGAAPFQDQEIDEVATVVEKLNAAGAVLVAKLSMGALAWGDVWYGGITKNPWNLMQGSSGSSAGSASATAAGLVPFAIGTETWGSIVSPSTRCGVSGLRPTFGRVSRHGAMALSWTMDKIGPICRSAHDCAMVFAAIQGKDPADPTTVDVPFNYDTNKNIETLRVGYIKEFFDPETDGNFTNDQQVLEELKEAGIELIEAELPTDLPVEQLSFILSAEAAAAFDQLTRSNQDTMLVRQIKNAWPNVFRSARFIPAVEYIQANRLRQRLIQEVNQWMQYFDVIITPSFAGNQLLMTNLTGHPCVVVPNGFNESGSPTSISFIGNLYDESSLLSFARFYQEMTEFEEQHPPYFQ